MSGVPSSPFRPLSAVPLRSLVRQPDQPHPAGSTADRLVALIEAIDTVYDQFELGLIVRVTGLGADEGELEAVSIWSHSIYDELMGGEFPPNCDAVAVMVHGRARSIDGDEDAPGEVLGRAKVMFAVARDGTSASLLRIDDSEPRVLVGGPDDCVGRIADVVRRGFGLPTAGPDDPVSSLIWLVWLDRIHSRVLRAESVDIALVDSLRPDLPATWDALIDECSVGLWPELRIHPELAEWMDEGMFSRACLEGFVEPLEVMIELGELLDRPVWLHLVDRLTGGSGY